MNFVSKISLDSTTGSQILDDKCPVLLRTEIFCPFDIKKNFQDRKNLSGTKILDIDEIDFTKIEMD